MKFFATLKLAKFASDLIAAAGFNLTTWFEAGNVNALADAIAAKSSDKGNAALEASLAEAVTENENISARLEQTNARHALLTKAITASGVKFADQPVGASQADYSAAFESAVKARAAVLAAEQLAAAGHPPLAINPAVDPTAPAPKTETKLHGSDRVRAAISARLAALAARQN